LTILRPNPVLSVTQMNLIGVDDDGSERLLSDRVRSRHSLGANLHHFCQVSRSLAASRSEMDSRPPPLISTGRESASPA
jgi:hypothetical protein